MLNAVFTLSTAPSQSVHGSARASVEEYDPTPVRDSRPLTRRARPTLTAAQINAGKAAARMQHMPGRAEKRMGRWVERKVGTKIYRRPSSTACKHSEGSNDTQVDRGSPPRSIQENAQFEYSGYSGGVFSWVRK